MPQKLPVNNFEWIKDTSHFNEDFIKNYNEESNKGYFLKLAVQYIEKLLKLHNALPSLPEIMKFEKVQKLVANLHDRLTNSVAFEKAIENVRKHRDKKLVSTERRRSYLVSEPSYHTTKFFKENLLDTYK